MGAPAPVLLVGRREVDAAHPGRDLASEGFQGDPRHASSGRPENGGSRHNTNSRGLVDAWDCDTSGNSAGPVNWQRLLACWARHPSAQNFIHNGKIWSRSWGWTPRAYGGPGKSAHTEHAHVESRLLASAEQDRRPWGYHSGPTPVVTPPVAGGVRGGMSRLPVLRRNPTVRKAAVGQLQRGLRKVGYTIGRFGVDFKFGNDTLAAVRRFQGDHGLGVDGVVGGRTWCALAQALLGGLGIDGRFGPKTAARVVEYQRAHGLTADGIVGPRTWGSLIG